MFSKHAKTTVSLVGLSALVLASAVVAATPLSTAQGAQAEAATTAVQAADGTHARGDFLVLFRGRTADPAARKAIARSGGTITEVNAKLGYAFVRSRDSGFVTAMNASGTVAGVARDRAIGTVRQSRAKASDIERLTRERKSAPGQGVADAATAAPTATGVTPEPLASRQWDMRQIGATAAGSYAVDQGSKKVLVGVIDTGIDGTHPDIAPNFSRTLSRNFVTDMVDIDGPCEHPSCIDPVNEDDDGHGTHVASTIGSPINGLGIAGVAPNVTLVNIRAGQDSGYFFLKATLDALTYAGDIGVDVVNMSFYTDPWLYNCTNNPADSPAEQAEQRTIRQATQRALNYAVHRGVLPVAAMGNEATDLNHPTSDDTSPDYPVDAAHPRTVDNSCISVPTESKGVMAVSSVGPSTRLAYYSNYGTEQTDVSAPGGDYYDSATNTGNPENLVLAAYPSALAEANGELNPDGTPNTPFVVRDCKGSVCAYYQYLQGTSMAAPHAVGVAALAVSRWGHRDHHGGLRLSPRSTARHVYASARKLPCPQPRLFHYTRILASGTVVESDSRCAGPSAKNGFYGRGLVNAFAVLRH
ncbi:MAG: S8 family serine peptidase [Nocardioidaceae bacterium]